MFRPVYDKSPLKKRLCSASDKRYSQTESSTFCKKSLQFPSKAKAGTIRGRSATIYSDYDYDDDDDDALANPLDKVNTPFQKYINKNKEQIRLKENSLWELQDKLKEFNDRLKVVKAQYKEDGKMCHNCHLRLNHTSRNCMNEIKERD